MKDKKILVIGGCGYIGTRLCDELRKTYPVDSVDIGWFGSLTPHNLQIDYRLLNVDFYIAYDVIILLAGHSSVQMCKNNGKASFQNNVANFIDLIEKINIISKHKRIKFIYASSSSVYGEFGGVEATENDTAFTPNNFYDLTKHEIDLNAPLYRNVEYYALRLGTVNGFSDNFRTDIMVNAMYRSFVDKGCVTLYNREIHRPILAISDLVEAVGAIIEEQPDKRGIYNLCSFNLTAGDIASQSATFLGCGVCERKPVTITNAKLQGKAYDFSISTLKFKHSFDFEFLGSIQSILDDITSRDESRICDDRNIAKEYGV